MERAHLGCQTSSSYSSPPSPSFSSGSQHPLHSIRIWSHLLHPTVSVDDEVKRQSLLQLLYEQEMWKCRLDMKHKKCPVVGLSLDFCDLILAESIREWWLQDIWVILHQWEFLSACWLLWAADWSGESSFDTESSWSADTFSHLFNTNLPLWMLWRFDWGLFPCLSLASVLIENGYTWYVYRLHCCLRDTESKRLTRMNPDQLISHPELC